MKTGSEMIAEERQRQIDVEGYKPTHDDIYRDGALAKAASCYCVQAYSGGDSKPPILWPWDSEYWKPSSTIRNLVKAGALIAAEIDRLNRMQHNPTTGKVEWK